MRSFLSLALAVVAVAAALSGCAAEATSGDFATTRNGLAVEGSAHLHFQREVKPLADEGAPGPVGDVCPPAGTPSTQFDCIPPATTLSVHFMSLPLPDEGGYTLYLTGGPGGDKEMGKLVAMDGGMFEFKETTFAEDYSDFGGIDVRMGRVVVAKTMNAEGEQAFTVNPELTGASAAGTWDGNRIEVTATGLPALEGVTYVAWLVEKDADGKATHVEQWPITPGQPTAYTAPKDISKYAEFHVHVGASKVNVAIGDLQVKTD